MRSYTSRLSLRRDNPLQTSSKALGGVGADSERATTEAALEWTGRPLAEASAGRGGEDAWKNKDGAVYLFEAVATRSGTLTVTSFSELVC